MTQHVWLTNYEAQDVTLLSRYGRECHTCGTSMRVFYPRREMRSSCLVGFSGANSSQPVTCFAHLFGPLGISRPIATGAGVG